MQPAAHVVAVCAVASPTLSNPSATIALPVVDTLIAHVFAQHAAVRREPRDGNAHVVVDFEDLALVGGQLRLAALQGGQNHVAVALRGTRKSGRG